MINTIYLALGSNVGNKKQNLQKAIYFLSKKINNIQVSNTYETKPLYYEAQENFVNAVMYGCTKLSPEDLLVFTQKTEKDIGRQKRFQNGPREIDIDILFYNDSCFKNDVLEIPHKKIEERDFVLYPFMDLNPNFIHPVLKKTIKELLALIPKKMKSILIR